MWISSTGKTRTVQLCLSEKVNSSNRDDLRVTSGNPTRARVPSSLTARVQLFSGELHISGLKHFNLNSDMKSEILFDAQAQGGGLRLRNRSTTQAASSTIYSRMWLYRCTRERESGRRLDGRSDLEPVEVGEHRLHADGGGPRADPNALQSQHTRQPLGFHGNQVGGMKKK